MIKEKGQEEMVGFALIMIIVAIILLIFLSFSLGKSDNEPVESYEVESFIQAFLQYTTDCRDNLEYVSIQKLIFDCEDGRECLDGRPACKVLNSTLKNILDESWATGEKSPVKGYKLEILSQKEPVIIIKKGNETKNSKGGLEILPQDIDIYFTAYY
ncbi:MAG: hypothetical protein P8X70_01275 [Nanoarchaeota archaeon]